MTRLARAVAIAIVVLAACGDDTPSAGTAPTNDDPPFRPQAVEDVDLLLVVGDSPSMGAKQAIFARAVPRLVASLIAPRSSGAVQEVKSLHVGVVTTSLGSLGTSACASKDDGAHLLPRAKDAIPSQGYELADGATIQSAACPTPIAATAVAWSFDAAHADKTTRFDGTTQTPATELASSCVIESAAQDGCGYAQTWEAAYRFLADPAPYATVTTDCTFGANADTCAGNVRVSADVDAEILAERANFLRPQALLAVVVLSDENDASMKPVGSNWLPWAAADEAMPRGWASCSLVPDDFEPGVGTAEIAILNGDPASGGYGCWSCAQAGKGGDPNCNDDWRGTNKRNVDADARKLRAFQEVQRFGYNFLWERDRYVNAFAGGPVCDATGAHCTNNPFGTKPVVLATIVGVPWQLVATPDHQPIALDEMAWAKLISPDLAKRDPHMIESIAPRSAVAKFAGDRAIDVVNGGDRDVEEGDDLQYACIAQKIDGATNDDGDCADPNAANVNPLCDGPGNQPYFKAYPGLRHLRIVHDVDAITHLGFVGSICDGDLRTSVSGIADRIDAILEASRADAVAANADGAGF